MRRSAGLPRLFASALLAVIAAGADHAVAQSGCEARRRSCIAECRAQHFTVDAKRDACVASCVAEANRCMRERAAAERGGAATLAVAGDASLTGPEPTGVAGLPKRAEP
jgi:tellurite resistance protein